MYDIQKVKLLRQKMRFKKTSCKREIFDFVFKNYVCKNIEHGFTPLDNLVEQRLCNKNKISYGGEHG